MADLLIGTYTRTGTPTDGQGGTGSLGVYAASFDGRDVTLGAATQAENPSFVAGHPTLPIFYTVIETGDYAQDSGGIGWWCPGDTSLRGRCASMGGDPCHLSLDPLGGYLVVSNYAGGTLATFGLDEDGAIGGLRSLIAHHGRGTDPVRQASPHVHSAVPSVDGFHLYAADLGLDELVRYAVRGGQVAAGERETVRLAPGAGPRHFCICDDVMYLVNELDSTVTRLALTAAGPLELSRYSALEVGNDAPSSAADIHLSRDGRFLYVSNRGQDNIAVFGVEGDVLVPLQHVGSGGRHPRHFALAPDERSLLVANTHSDCVVVFARDVETGRLAEISRVTVPAPTCIFFR